MKTQLNGPGSTGKDIISVDHSSSLRCVEASSDTEELVKLKATVAELQEQLNAKDKNIEVHIHVSWLYILCTQPCYCILVSLVDCLSDILILCM